MRVHTNAQLACHRLTLPRKEVKTERGREREGREKEREKAREREREIPLACDLSGVSMSSCV